MAYADNFVGQTMKNGTNGCVEAVGMAGAGNSQFLANQYNNHVYDVPTLVNNAQQQGIPVVPFDPQNLSAGDVAVYGDNDHVTLADGNGGYYGNSSSQNQIIHGNDITAMGGLKPTSIIKTGGGSFNYQAKDANGQPFLSMQANLRTSDPHERFDQQSIMDILSKQTPTVESQLANDFIYRPDYSTETLALPADVAKYVQPTADKLMANREADLKARVNQESSMNRMQQAVQLANLINSSNSIDNRREYSALGKMVGISMPDGSDQFVSGNDLLKSQIQQNQAEQTYNQKNKQMEMQDKLSRDKMAMQERMFEASQALKAQQLASRGGGVASGGGSGASGIDKASEARSMIDWIDKQTQEHPEMAQYYERMRPRAEATLLNHYDPPNPDDYQWCQRDWDGFMANNLNNISNNRGALTPDQLHAAAVARYGNYGDEIFSDTDLAQWGY